MRNEKKRNLKLTYTLSVAIMLLVAGCSNPADGVAAAKVSSPTAAEAAIPAQEAEQARPFVFGPESGTIQFVGSKVTGSHDGGFKNFSGELHVLSDGRLAETGNQVTIDTTSLWSDNERLTGHLKSPDFFDAEKFPASTFVTTAISQQGTNATVTGNLTLHGVTKQISFPAAIEAGADKVKVQALFSINRFDFEMKYPGKVDDLIRKEVVLKIDVTAVPAARSQVAAR